MYYGNWKGKTFSLKCNPFSLVLEYIFQMENVFRQSNAEKVGNDFPKNQVLYGGSANENNIEKLKCCPLIDGYLLGGLSLKIESLKMFLEKLEN